MAADQLGSKSNQPYVYAPLDPSRKQVRLVRLLPDTENVGLEIECFDFDEHLPDYRALSYTWGDDTARHKIAVDGRMIEVSTNLRDFLLVCSAKRKADWLFVDQLCINQVFTAERNTQVAMMAEIYGRALEVIIWLNPADGSAEPWVLSAAKNLFHNLDELTVDELSSRDFGAAENMYAAIFGNRYWSRLWTIQEILLARERIIYFGRTHATWTTLQYLQTGWGHGHLASFFEIVENASENGVKLSLGKALSNFHLYECLDDRDKVYGLLGIVDPTDTRAVEVDYRKSPKDILFDILPRLIADLYDEAQVYGSRETFWYFLQDALRDCQAIVSSLLSYDIKVHSDAHLSVIPKLRLDVEHGKEQIVGDIVETVRRIVDRPSAIEEELAQLWNTWATRYGSPS